MATTSAPYRRILVPVDGSDTSKLGLREALKLAALSGAKVRLLHIVDVSIVETSMDAATNINGILDLMRASGQKVLEQAAAAAEKKGIRAEVDLAEAIAKRPAEVIVEAGRRWRADLIVMGTHGRRGFNRLFLGSTAEGVLRTADTPVFLVRAMDKTSKRARKSVA